jgi:EAL domain-containing protein (putative c-di-GMP-specific phosphodiesterase class I)
MTVIAEGIEHAGIVAALIDHGCDEAQGYHYAKPLTVADFHRYMLAHQEALPA